MKNVKLINVVAVFLLVSIVFSAFTSSEKSCKTVSSNCKKVIDQTKPNQLVNMFVTHGHCATPFAGKIDNIKVDFGPLREDQGNPVENMDMSFIIDPNTFNVCSGDELTNKIKTPGLFIGENDEKITFQSTEVFTMGLDWYQVNGKFSIKGVEKEVKLFVTGLRNPKSSKPERMIIQGQFDLFDWGIDYDKIVNGKSDPAPTKWFYLNMNIELC